MRKQGRNWAVIAGLALLTLGGCSKSDPLYADQAWVRASSDPARPSAAYFTIHGGPRDAVLAKVASDGASRVEMHDNVMQGGMMKMVPLPQLTVPAGGEIAFAPGGKHVMLWDVNPAALKAGKLPLTLIFADGQRIIVDADIRAQGGDAPSGDHMGH